MTISKRTDWGTVVRRPDGLIEASSDRALADLVGGSVRDAQFGDGDEDGDEDGHGGERAAAPLTVTGGDLYRSLGSPPARDSMVRLPIDVMSVTLDGVQHYGIGQLLIYRSRWRGPAVAVCNVSFFGDWNLAPKAHPNDGLLDVVEVDERFGTRMRVQARQRMRTGTHVPHPLVRYSRVSEYECRLARPTPCFLDHRDPIRAEHVRVVVVPDAAFVHV